MNSLVVVTLLACEFVILLVTASPPCRKFAADRIVGGLPARKNEFPYIVQITRGGYQYCGGSVVNANWVLTAAHCATASISGYVLIAGAHKLDSRDGTEQIRNVSQIILHQNYSSSSMANDMALMKVTPPFQMNNVIKAVEIPDSFYQPDDDHHLTVAGWGTLSSGGILPSILMKVNVPFVPLKSCRESYGTQIVAGMLCAGMSGKDSCQGDSGGPLVSGSILAGVTSWGRGCAAGGYPGVYADVAYYSEWISQNTNS